MNQIGIWGVLTVLCFTLNHGVKTVTVDFAMQTELTEQETVLCTNKNITFCLPTEGADAFVYAYALKQEQDEEFGKWKKIKQGEDVVSVNQVKQVKFRQTERESGVIRLHTYHIVPDDIKPEIALEVISDNDQTQNPIDLEQWQNHDISCNVKITDTGCGLKQIGCKVMGEVLWEEFYTENETKRETMVNFMLTNETDQNGAPFEIYAIDRAGNETLYQKIYYLDKQIPTVSVNGIKSDQYYISAQQLEITVQENIWQYANVCMEIIKQLDEMQPHSEKVYLPLQATESIFIQEFSEEGDYTVRIYAYDKAGNQSEPCTVSFRIDLNAPKISILGVKSGESYCVEKEISIAVEESFYKDNQVQITVKKAVPDYETPYLFGEWKNQARTSKLSHVFREDGHYALDVIAKDAAGNATAHERLRFIIDRTAPVIGITGVIEGEVRKGEIPVKFCVEELFFATSQTQITIVKESSEGLTGQVVVPAYTADGYQTITEHIISGEGKYHIEMQTADAAGNIAKVQKSFAIDNTPPIIGYIDTIEKTYSSGFVLPQNFGDYITDMSLFTYYLYINGKLFDERTKLTKPGNYILKVEAMDEAGNTSMKSVQFIIQRELFSILSEKLPLHDGLLSDDTKTGIKTNKKYDKGEQSKEIESKELKSKEAQDIEAQNKEARNIESSSNRLEDGNNNQDGIIRLIGIFIIVLACTGLVMCHIDRKSSV